MSKLSSASPPESTHPRWQLRLALLRRRVAAGALLVVGAIALAVVVFAVSRAGPVLSGSGDAAVQSIPTDTALPAPVVPTPGIPDSAIPAPAIPAPAVPTPGVPNPAAPTPAIPTPAATAAPGSEADPATNQLPAPGAGPDGVAGSPGSAAPNIIPPGTPPVTIGQAGPAILSFAPHSPVAMCPDEFTAKVPLEFRWNTQEASQGWFAAGTTNALGEEATPVDLAAQGLSDVAFDCSDNQQIYALTISDGSETVSATTFVVRRLIWPDG